MLFSRSCILFIVLLNLNHFKRAFAQGLDVGPSDPLKIGQIDPVSLEVASTYVFIVPFVIFVFGILFIPVSLVIIFLFVVPFLVPGGNPERRSISHVQLLHQGFIPSSTTTQQQHDDAQSYYYSLLNSILSAVQSQGQQ